MTILPQLERDLYEAAHVRLPVDGQGDPVTPPTVARRGHRLRARLGNALVAASFVLVLAVAGAVLVLTGNHATKQRTSSPIEVNWAPTLAQLRAHFAILRRPQTAADRAASPLLGAAGQSPVTIIPRYTRLAGTLPGGGRVFLTVGRAAGPYAGPTAGSYLLSAWVLSTRGGATSVLTGPSYRSQAAYDWLPAPVRDPHGTILMSIVPDGVQAVGWVFPGSSILAVVDGNVAVGRLTEAAPAVPEKVYWYGKRGHVLKVFTVGPPKRVLRGNGIANATFGEPAHTVIARLSGLLGPPATSLSLSACGPIDTISWRNLLAVFRNGRFIGYAYGSQSPQAAPGPLLATARGLTLGETMAQGSRLYGAAFRTSEEQGGTWSLTTPTGQLDGFAYSKVPPKHGDVGAQSTITSVQAGPFICAALSP